jgi:hypothetical protein
MQTFYIHNNKKNYTGNDGIIYQQEATIDKIDAAAKTIYNEDHGKFVNFMYVLTQYKQIYLYINIYIQSKITTQVMMESYLKKT